MRRFTSAEIGWRPRRVGSRIALILVAGTSACFADGLSPSDERLDAATSPRADAGASIDATPAGDAGPDEADAEPRCALPMSIDLDGSGLASFFYDHPDCSGASGRDPDATLVFEDRVDTDDVFAAAAPEQQWEVQDLPYPELDCIVLTEENSLYCEGVHAGDLIPIRLFDGAVQLDIDFVFDHDGQTVAIESLER